MIPADFIVFGPTIPSSGADTHHDLLVANCFRSRSPRVRRGTAEEVAETETDPLLVARTFPGNRPSTTIMAPPSPPRCSDSSWPSTNIRCSPRASCGGSTASISGGWNWQVLASAIVGELPGADTPDLRHGASTNALIERYRSMRGR